MIHIKKTILTLALLIAATTQAWATDYLHLDISSNGKSATIYYGDPEGKPYLDPNNGWMQNGDVWDFSCDIKNPISTVTIDESCQKFSGNSLFDMFHGFASLNNIIGFDNLRTDDVKNITLMFHSCSSLTSVDLSSFNTANVYNMSEMFYGCIRLTSVDLSSFNTANVTYMTDMFYNCSMLETIYVGNGWSTNKVSLSNGMFTSCSSLPGYQLSNPTDKQMAKLTTAGGYLTYKAPPTSVPLTQGTGTDANQWSLTDKMPAGNVTVSVKYFTQARFTNGGAPAAITGVQASTDNPIVTAGTVKTIGTSSVKMGTVMYYAAQSSSTAPTYDSEGWSEAVPTAATFSEGDVYVWYYIAGAEPASVAERIDDNTCSDSDIKRLTVNLDAPPTYDVVINTAGLSAKEAGKWSASPNTGVKKGDEVTVTYTGSRKVIGVKAEKTGPLYMKWDDSQKALVPTEIPATVTKVENAYVLVEWPAGTYLVEGDVDIDGYIILNGDVDLIIKDGAKLTAKVIYGHDNYNLSVYGQTNMSGELNLACSGDDAINCMNALNIHSCKVNAYSSSENYGGLNKINEINVYGGSVDAEYTGDSNGYGLKFNYHLNIYGGEVKAVGKGNDNSKSYGISCTIDASTVNVYGGKLWAECADNRAFRSDVTFTKDNGYTSGKIETSADGTYWTVYSGTGTPDAPYVRVGY